MGAGMEGQNARPNDVVESVDPGSLAGVTSGTQIQDLTLSSGDSIVQALEFSKFRSSAERAVEQYLPSDPNAKLEVKTSWGETLTAKHGDYLVGSVTDKNDRWVVQKDIFESTYQMVREGVGVKSALIELVPLAQITGNDNTIVTVNTLEGSVKARAGDFYLARGVQGEIWPYPKAKVEKELAQVG